MDQKVVRRVAYVKETTEKGENNHQKTVSARTGYKMHSQYMGVNEFEQDDQLQDMKEIGNFIAHEAPISTVSKLINEFHKVRYGLRKNNANITVFV